MMILARRIEHPLDVPIERPHHADAYASAAPDLPPPWISASVAACHSGLSCFDLDNAANDAAGQRAPFNMHDVEQVTVFPWSHLMQTATH